MEPIEFPEQTKVLEPPEGWDQEENGECGRLPVGVYDGQVISCWKLSWKERLQMLFCGRLWVFVFSGATQPPISFLVGKSAFKPAE